jgi:hypothetical protein
MDEDLDSLDDLALWRMWIESPEGKAREKLHEALEDLRLDPEIAASPLCANFLDLVLRIDPSSPEADTVFDLVEPLTAYFHKLQARRNAQRSHAAKNEAKKFIVAEWSKHREDYKNNKTAFANDYVRRVANEFSDASGDPLKISTKQIREVWLSNHPVASKQAG